MSFFVCKKNKCKIDILGIIKYTYNSTTIIFKSFLSLINVFFCLKFVIIITFFNLKLKKRMKNFTLKLSLFLLILLTSCSKKTETVQLESSFYIPSQDKTCTLKNGIHTGSMYYYDKKTAYSRTYISEIDIHNCEINKINFEDGTSLNKNQIYSTPIDKKGKVTVTTNEGIIYEICIKK